MGKVKVRLGRYLGFEIQQPEEKVSVTSLKAQIRYLEQKLMRQERYIVALLQGYTYIRDLAGNFYRLYNDATLVDKNGQVMQADWRLMEAMLPNGVIVEFCRRIDGALQRWAPDEQGALVQVQ